LPRSTEIANESPPHPVILRFVSPFLLLPLQYLPFLTVPSLASSPSLLSSSGCPLMRSFESFAPSSSAFTLSTFRSPLPLHHAFSSPLPHPRTTFPFFPIISPHSPPPGRSAGRCGTGNRGNVQQAPTARGRSKTTSLSVGRASEEAGRATRGCWKQSHGCRSSRAAEVRGRQLSGFDERGVEAVVTRA